MSDPTTTRFARLYSGDHRAGAALYIGSVPFGFIEAESTSKLLEMLDNWFSDDNPETLREEAEDAEEAAP